MSIESPKYKVVERDNKFEIRDYSKYIAAEVDVEAGYNDALNTGFGILAGYIFGGNSARASIAMTAPVTEKSEKIPMTKPVSAYHKQGQVYTISFSMPRKYSLDTLPQPNDANIRLREVPAARVAALRFSGSLNERLVTKKTSELTEWLKQKNLHPKSTVASCQYNPPWIPGPFRTNEVMVNI